MTSLKTAVFWDAAPWSLLNIDQIFTDANCLRVKMEAVSSSETPVNIYHTTRRKVLENSNFNPQFLAQSNSA
jgi:hypothetical protein